MWTAILGNPVLRPDNGKNALLSIRYSSDDGRSYPVDGSFLSLPSVTWSDSAITTQINADLYWLAQRDLVISSITVQPGVSSIASFTPQQITTMQADDANKRALAALLQAKATNDAITSLVSASVLSANDPSVSIAQTTLTNAATALTQTATSLSAAQTVM